MNSKKLRGKMVEQSITMQQLAKQLNINTSTLYRRFNKPEMITVADVIKIKDFLSLTKEDVEVIFFAS